MSHTRLEAALVLAMTAGCGGSGGTPTPVTGLAPGPHRLFAKCGDAVDRQTGCSTPPDLIFIFSIAG